MGSAFCRPEVSDPTPPETMVGSIDRVSDMAGLRSQQPVPGPVPWEGPQRIKTCQLDEPTKKRFEELLGRIFTEEAFIGKKVVFYPEEIAEVIEAVIPILKSEPMLIEDVPFDVTIVGDIHGYFRDLHGMVKGDSKECMKFLFLGDYMYRGRQSIEVMTMLFILKCLHPDQIFLLRGNHEFSTENIKFNAALSYLSVAAIVGNSYFCASVGIGPTRDVLKGMQLDAKRDTCLRDAAGGSPSAKDSKRQSQKPPISAEKNVNVRPLVPVPSSLNYRLPKMPVRSVPRPVKTTHVTAKIVPAQARTLQPPRVMSRVVLPINQKIDRSFDAIDPNDISAMFNGAVPQLSMIGGNASHIPAFSLVTSRPLDVRALKASKPFFFFVQATPGCDGETVCNRITNQLDGYAWLDRRELIDHEIRSGTPRGVKLATDKKMGKGISEKLIIDLIVEGAWKAHLAGCRGLLLSGFPSSLKGFDHLKSAMWAPSAVLSLTPAEDCSYDAKLSARRAAYTTAHEPLHSRFKQMGILYSVNDGKDAAEKIEKIIRRLDGTLTYDKGRDVKWVEGSSNCDAME